MVSPNDEIDPTSAAWQRSSFSEPSQPTCVEVAALGSHVGLRDSTNPAAGALVLTDAAWAAFRKGVRTGEFD